MASAVSAQPAPSPVLERKAKALSLIYKESVAQPEGSAERQKLYTEFLQDSAALLKEMPNAINIWLLRAAIAIEINDATVGRQAGLRLIALGADKSPEASIQDLLVQLERRKWLDDEKSASNAGAGDIARSLTFVPIPGTGVRFCIWEIRITDYAKFVKATGRNWKQRQWQEESHPAVDLAWEDANAFCIWLTTSERSAGRLNQNQRYRLPTDAEWSMAAGLTNEEGDSPAEKGREAREKPIYYWGKRLPPPNNTDNYDLIDNEFEGTAPVGSFPPNKHGLFDMGGNVREWVADRYGDDGTQGEQQPYLRVYRGADWKTGQMSDSEFLIGYRATGNDELRSTRIGFRIVLVSL